jgi:hypothetical protein
MSASSALSVTAESRIGMDETLSEMLAAITTERNTRPTSG